MKSTRTSGTVRLSVAGAIVQGRATGALGRAVAGALVDRPERIVVDVSDVDLLDASGIGELIACRAIAREAGVPFRIRGAMGKVLEILRITGLEPVLLCPENGGGRTMEVHRIVA